MGYKANGRLTYILICLLATACLVYLKPSQNTSDAKEPLDKVFQNVSDWKSVRNTELQKNVIDALELDDYLFRTYSKDQRMVALYIGYYRTSTKIGAAHSPLVCFPGQGWEISVPEKVDAELASGKINAEKLIAKKGVHHELLLYWFQSYDMTSSGTFFQKVNNFWARLTSRPEDNAFVRVSVAIRDDNNDEALQTAIDFIRDFYPRFIRHIKT
jgi:EpsI family protein